ncbi:hypothetical protein [Lawsonella sp.]|uniref:hypothetical protein n=1 Tax=Lawsonella sp. TaxID=2041415 RepID=UPI0025C4478C|nr:hypothetical protein [Lawsonella sp.]
MPDTTSTEKNRDKTNLEAKTIRIDQNESGYWLTPTVGPGGCYVPGEYSLATLQSTKRSIQKTLNTYKKSKRPALEKIACLEQAIPIVDAAISEYQEEIS